MTNITEECDSIPEQGAQKDAKSGWKQLYGNFEKLGVSVELHNFKLDSALDWGRSFHRPSIELCLNLSGRGTIRRGREECVLSAETVAFYITSAEEELHAKRLPEDHHFLTVEFSPDGLAQRVAGYEDDLDPLVRIAGLTAHPQSAISTVRPLRVAENSLFRWLANPPVSIKALPLWYEAKVMEVIAVFLCPQREEPFCQRQKRLSKERVERVCEILDAQYAAPPTLETISREVGISQFYLSRTFAAQTGLTIPQYLRRVRMERAAELLRAGTHNVAEAAFAVGYSSLPHFSKSFREVIGYYPNT